MIFTIFLFLFLYLFQIRNADFNFHCDATADDLIDIIEGNRIYIPCIYVLNKIDQITIEALDVLSRTPHCCPISAHHHWNLDDLLEMMWGYLNLFRMYGEKDIYIYIYIRGRKQGVFVFVLVLLVLLIIVVLGAYYSGYYQYLLLLLMRCLYVIILYPC